MNRGGSRLAFALTVLSIAIGMVMWQFGPCRPAHSELNITLAQPAIAPTVNQTPPIKWQSDYGMKVLNHSENMPCKVLEQNGRSLLMFTPPTDKDRQLAIISPKNDWMYLSSDEYPARRGIAKTFYVNPQSQRVEEDVPSKESFRHLTDQPLFRGAGEYEIILSEVLDVDIELVEWQASCRVKIWKK
jgi:hypothetical protein